MILELLIGVAIIHGIGEYAKRKSSVYIVARSNIEKWLDKVYKVKIENLKCSICGRPINKDNIKRVYSGKGQPYFICNNTSCIIKSKEVNKIVVN